jgi:hypothetical protein
MPFKPKEEGPVRKINEWTHQFENVASIVYFGDLGCSDDGTFDNQPRV